MEHLSNRNSFLRETDTTLLEKDDRKNLKRQKRRVVSDKMITPRLFDLLVTKVYSDANDIYHVTQEEVIKILLPKNICNETIARVINVVIPDAKATQGSVASMIRFINRKNNKVNTLARALEAELEAELGCDI